MGLIQLGLLAVSLAIAAMILLAAVDDVLISRRRTENRWMARLESELSSQQAKRLRPYVSYVAWYAPPKGVIRFFKPAVLFLPALLALFLVSTTFGRNGVLGAFLDNWLLVAVTVLPPTGVVVRRRRAARIRTLLEECPETLASEGDEALDFSFSFRWRWRHRLSASLEPLVDGEAWYSDGSSQS